MPITVTVVYSPKPREVKEVTLQLEEGATLGQALQSSGLLAGQAQSELDSLEWGVWGRKLALEYRLRAGDRVELYRQLTVDPKVARRQRFVGQGAKKAAGLFAKRRPGAAAGY